MDPNARQLVRKIATDLDAGQEKAQQGISFATLDKKPSRCLSDIKIGLRHLGFFEDTQAQRWTPRKDPNQMLTFVQRVEELEVELRTNRPLDLVKLDHVERGIPFGLLKEWWLQHKGPPEETMRDFVKRVVEPLAELYHASIAEIQFGKHAGPVDVFLNHTWETPLATTMCSLSKLFEGREWSSSKRIFICAFALNQSDVGGELSQPIEHSPFVRVLKDMKDRSKTDFATNVELDGKLFKRAWVVLEDSKALLNNMDMIFITPKGELGNNAEPQAYEQLVKAITDFNPANMECKQDADKELIMNALKHDWKERGGMEAFIRQLRSRYRQAVEQAIQQLINVLPSLVDQPLLPDGSVMEDDLVEENLVDKGGFGKVYKVRYAMSEVAAKVLDLPVVAVRRIQVLRDCEAEFRSASRLRHPNIVQMYGIVRFKSRIAIVQELCEGGNLRDYLDLYKDTLKDDETRCRSFVIDVAAGLAYMHRLTMAHRDIKSPNLLISYKSNASLIVKLADFGLSRLDGGWNSAAGTVTLQQGTLAWMAPELIESFQREKNTCVDLCRADVYSFGVVTFEIISQKWPVQNVKSYMCDPPSGKVGKCKAFQDIMTTCMSVEPQNRPLMSQVLDYLTGKAQSLIPPSDESDLNVPIPSVLPDLSRKEAESKLVSEQLKLQRPSIGVSVGSALEAVRQSHIRDQAFSPEVDGPVSSAQVSMGDLVCSGIDWMWGKQDGEGGLGKVVAVDCTQQWVQVAWDCGHVNWYRAGADCQHDLEHLSSSLLNRHNREYENALKSGHLRSAHLKRTFGYKTGVKNPHFSYFDIRDDVCQSIGGFTHGQAVKLHQGGRKLADAVTIGVKPDPNGVLHLWFHQPNAEGAGLFPREDLPKIAPTGRRHVYEARRSDVPDNSDDESDNRDLLEIGSSLDLSFGYPMGRVSSKFARFDTRESVCRKVGGFAHGDYISIETGDDMKYLVVIGIQLDEDTQTLPLLFLHDDGDLGAGTIPKDQWAKFRSHIKLVGHRDPVEVSPHDPMFSAENYLDMAAVRLSEIKASLQLTFCYWMGTVVRRQAKFDIRDSVCRDVGGFLHGQIIKDPSETEHVVIGVRLNQDRDPCLFFHELEKPGAGIFPGYRKIYKHLKVVGHQKVLEVTPDPGATLD